MKTFKIQIIFLFISAFIFQFFVFQKTIATNYFDTYRNDISWNAQKAHLDNFAFYLKNNPEMTGYIAVFKTKNESLKSSKSQTYKTVRYITQKIDSQYRMKTIALWLWMPEYVKNQKLFCNRLIKNCRVLISNQ